MHPHAMSVQRRVWQAWDNVRANMQQIYPAADIRPSQSNDIFKLDPTVGQDEVKFKVAPIVCSLPERASYTDPNLYVVLSGWLSFHGADLRTTPLLTKSFGTEVGYFRFKKEDVTHVYGAHYDLEEQMVGHPVFHAQIAAKPGFLDVVNALLHKKYQAAEDNVKRMLTNVRTPSAQMDVFSVMIQLCADHLIDKRSSAQALDAFKEMRSATKFFIGAAHRMAFLNSSPAPSCYRSMHWYP